MIEVLGRPVGEVSVFTKLVNPDTAGKRLVDPEGHLINPANILSASRPVLAGWAFEKLIHGEQWVTPIALAMIASDAEGYVARFFDAHFPQWHIGTSKYGPEADQYADATALLIFSAGALLGPKVSMSAKLAVGAVLGQEGIKAAWAIGKNFDYRAAGGDRLEIPSSLVGKLAMAEKLVAVALAGATNDFDGRTRATLGAGALAFAGVGTARGALAVHGSAGYAGIVSGKIQQRLELAP